MKAIKKGLRIKCNRCGNSEKIYFARTDCSCNNGLYCRKCLVFGKLSCCSEYEADELFFDYQEPELQLSYKLSSLQLKASDFLLRQYQKGRGVLLVAVCGAGKTEIIYDLLIKAITLRKKVCIAIPRVEVVKELAKRIEKDLKVNVSRLYGGSDDSKEATMFISTCNQLIKYPKVFDLIVLDEADAFPYSSSDDLQYAVRNALSETGVLIKMTATPTIKDKYFSKMRKMIIRARYHKYRMDLPGIQLIDDYFAFITEYMNTDKIVIIYVPSIEYLKKCQLHFEDKCLYISSQSDNKEQILLDFKKGTKTILFSTTLLERGLTFENLNVIVIKANAKVFSISSLIQICGRVGRKSSAPRGEITFLCDELRLKLLIVKFSIWLNNIISRVRGDIY